MILNSNHIFYLQMTNLRVLRTVAYRLNLLKFRVKLLCSRVFPHQVIGIFLPLDSVELVPIQFPCYSSSKDKSSHHQVNQVQANHRLIKWSLLPPFTPPVPLPGRNAMPYGLETFWQSAFCWFFRPFVAAHGHLWTLEPTELPPLSVEWPWHSTSFSAKARFQCKCIRGWTSMKGQVSFWFRSVAKATRSCVKRCSNYLVKNVASATSQTHSMSLNF
ncbi:uncharacterized protein LOC124325478 isoform X2 [Daphnia pulicaria]|uniref:uncharacterized protein LOC124325478 isoform X2 n=1 Tax=Daphnia pulicaria TaxID=35523 RepID=UPI001EEB8A26|nr:uncharacterized protein LOC124325478 isoform X2 [Daphnia pulicaria]